METLLKLTSYKPNKNCNCITPFHITDISGINPNTQAEFTDNDRDVIKTAFYRISNSRGCKADVCCDPNDPFTSIDKTFMDQFKQTYPKIMPIYNGSTLDHILLSTTKDVKQSGWIEPTPLFVCRITKATITPTDDPNIFTASNLVRDCFTDSCTDVEKITLQNLIANSKTQMGEYTAFDDRVVANAITDGNIDAVKQFVRKYKSVDAPLTFDDYNNRMLHLAAMSKNRKIMQIIDLLVALKANVNVRNKNNETPIHLAITSGNTNVVDRLISVGADLTVANNKGETPIFYAVKSGDLGLVRMLYNAGAPVLVVDGQGNNLIHYAILYTPVNGENALNAQTNKAQIIKFLLESGVNGEGKNKSGLTPLELVGNRLDKIKGIGKDTEDDANFLNQVKEAFFGGGSSDVGGATKDDTVVMTPDEVSLLEIQTMLFNNIIRNNPNKYGGYINVADIPAGAPIDVLDTVCVGGMNTGNEDSATCSANGGQIVKIKNKTTLVKLELLPEEQSEIDKVKEQDLYMKKIGNKVPISTQPKIVSNYNKTVMNTKANAANNIVVAPTVGLKYNIGQDSTNEIQQITDTSGVETISTVTTIPVSTTEHPVISVEKSIEGKQAAIDNTVKLAKQITPTQVSANSTGKLVQFINNNIWIFASVIVIILLVLAVMIYKDM